jgi:hypothetical protein
MRTSMDLFARMYKTCIFSFDINASFMLTTLMIVDGCATL